MVPTDTEDFAIQEYSSDERQDEHLCTIDSSLTAIQADAPRFDSCGDNQFQYPRSRISGKTRIVASGGRTAGLIPSHSGRKNKRVSVRWSHDGMADGGSDQPPRPSPSLQDVKNKRVSVRWSHDGMADRGSDQPPRPSPSLQDVKNTLNDLWLELDTWCAAPLAPTDPEMSGPAHPCDSDTRGAAPHTFPCYPHYASQISHYISYHFANETALTANAFSLAYPLSNIASRPKSHAMIPTVAADLQQLRNMLCNLGMPTRTLQKLALLRTQVAEVAAGAFGDKEWVLYNMWKCAADELSDRWNCGGGPQAAAKRAANAALRLISISPPHADFYHACNLYYTAISECGTTWWEYERAYSQVERAVEAFRDAISSNSSPDHVEEMMRAMVTQSTSPHYNSNGMKAVHEQIISHGDDPAWAILCVDIGSNIDPVCLDQDSSEMILCLVTHAIKVLSPYQSALPTRMGRLAARAHATRGAILRKTYRQPEATQDMQKAVDIQASVTNLGEKDDVEPLGRFLRVYLDHQLRTQPFQYALGTVKQARKIVGSHCPAESEILASGLQAFRSHLHANWVETSLRAACAAIDELRPSPVSRHSQAVYCEFVSTLFAVSLFQRTTGDFEAALDASREAFAAAQELQIPDSGRGYVEACYCMALHCHANSLVDSDAYEAAAGLLQQTISMWKAASSPEGAALLRELLHGLGVVYAYVPSCIDEMISTYGCTSDADPLRRRDSERAWLLFLRAVAQHATSPLEASASARESLALTSQHAEPSQMTPYVRAAASAYRYILLSILEERQENQAVLKESVSLFRTVLAVNPRMARLPLLNLLDVLIVLVRALRSPSETSFLRTWKNSVYKGSTHFFNDFVTFLECLPLYIRGWS